MPVDCPFVVWELKDVSFPLPGLVPDSEGLAGAPVDTVCPLDMGRLNDVLLPLPGRGLDPEGRGLTLV